MLHRGATLDDDEAQRLVDALVAMDNAEDRSGSPGED
jgi:hypothetical protein